MAHSRPCRRVGLAVATILALLFLSGAVVSVVS